jgi:hypothetical protein
MPAPLIAAAAVGAAGDLLGGLISYFGQDAQLKQNARQWNDQKQMWETSRADSNAQFGQTLGETQRQFNTTSAFNTQKLGVDTQLANRGYDVQEKQVNANIAESKATRAQALKQKKLDDSLALLGYMTQFFNTPQARQQFANVWK